MAILNRFFLRFYFAAIRLEFLAPRCGIPGDSGPAILGIVRFAIRDSVPLRSSQNGGQQILSLMGGLG